MQCWNCEGEGCEYCEHGYHFIRQCPIEHIGSRLIREVNMIVYAMKNTLPEAGGLLDQDAKFVHTWQAFESDKQLIDAERMSKQKHGR